MRGKRKTDQREQQKTKKYSLFHSTLLWKELEKVTINIAEIQLLVNP
jgi:hypothetical protein